MQPCELLHAAKLESALRGCVVGVELEAARLVQHRRLLLIIHTKVRLEDLDSHVVDLVVFVPLQLFNLVNTAARFNRRHKRIGP